MNFKVRKIRKQFKTFQDRQKKDEDQKPSALHPSETPAPLAQRSEEQLNRHNKLIRGSVLGIALLCLIVIVFLSIQLVKSIDFGSLIFSFGQALKTDSEGQTNFLLVGVGGEGHEGSNLTDTLIIANLDSNNNHVKLLSLPRDLYITDPEIGDSKINKVYDSYLNKHDQNSRLALSKLQNKVGEITGLQIEYVIKINFNGFLKIVDSLGGIDINVEKAIYDPYYPLGETIQYTTFSIDSGPQHLDGATALKYARSRKTTSDFDRAKRQQEIMVALREKALSLNILTDPSRLQSLYQAVASSIDTNLNIGEILELARISKDIDKNQIENRILNDDFTSCGGILYTPPRDQYSGASVLIPIGSKNQELQKFIKEYFHTSTTVNNEEIQILNGTKINGLAGTYLNLLSRACLNTVYYGNAIERDLEKSIIYYQPDSENKKPAALSIVQQIIKAPEQAGIPAEYLDTAKRQNSVVVVVLGKDYPSIAQSDPFDSLPAYVPPVIAPEVPLNAGTAPSPVAPTPVSPAQQ